MITSKAMMLYQITLAKQCIESVHSFNKVKKKDNINGLENRKKIALINMNVHVENPKYIKKNISLISNKQMQQGCKIQG